MNVIKPISLLGEPFFYRGLLIYPVTMKNYLNFMYAVDVLRQKKNRIPDIAVIKMPYLKFIFDYLMVQEDGERYEYMLRLVLALSLSPEQSQSIIFKTDGNSYFMEYTTIEGTTQVITEKDFDEFKNVVLDLNGLEDANYEISEEVEKALEEAEKEKAKMHNRKPTTIEDMIDSYHVGAGFSYAEIGEEPIAKFIKNVKRFVNREDYVMFKTAELSGNVKFKQEIQHWLRPVESEGRYSDARVDLNKFTKDFYEKVGGNSK